MINRHLNSLQNDAVAGVQNDVVVGMRSNIFVPLPNDTAPNDTIAYDTITNDTLNLEDARPPIPLSRSAIENRIDYKAQDSIFFDLRTNTVHLFEEAQVNYRDIELTAARINVHFDRDELSAFPRLDSLGEEVGRPFFSDAQQTFEARELTYNLATRKARIRNIITQEDEMLIHGDRVKKFPDNTAFVQRARFTTCELEHPHWFIVANRARIIPNDRVVTGAAMMFLNDVPTPLAIPFGLFPNTSRYSSGILIPTYGESFHQGFFLRGGGFYWAINDFVDWRIEGDIYSQGEWAIRNTWQYAVRYRFTGRLNMEMGMVPSGERGVTEGADAFGQTRSFRLGWNHSQAPEANQNSSFSASVNFFNSASQSYSSNIADHFNNQSTSNIAYQLRFGRFNLAATASFDYNTRTGNINATLPSVNFSMRPIFPFQRRVRVGAPRWYESFRVGYSMSAVNRVSGNDSTFFSHFDVTLRNMLNGMRHNIPMSLDVRLLNGFINWNHSIQLTEHWNFRKNYRGLDTTGFNYVNVFDENNELIRVDTVPIIQRNAIIRTEYGFFRAASYSYTTSLSTTLFGISRFRRGPIRAFRHVATPSIGFSISPDFVEGAAGLRSGYRHFTDIDGTERRYNLFEGSPGGFPTGGLSGSINFSLGNNFEMKIRDRSDTVRGERRVRLIDRLQISTSYNLAADSLNWAPIRLSASTRLFGNLVLNYSATFSLYARDSLNRPINTFIWQTPGRSFLLRETETMNTGLSWTWSSRNRDTETELSRASETEEIFQQRATFAPQWSLSVSYNINYRSNFRPGYQRTDIWGRPIVGEQRWRDYDQTIMQTLSLSGHINLTDKWHISFTSGYDFVSRQLGHTMFNVTRNLCCWTMTFTWAPFGQFREWSFGIRLNSNMLGDVMKYDRRRTHREFDNF